MTTWTVLKMPMPHLPVDANGVPLHHYFARDVASKVLMDMINALPESVYFLNHTDGEWVTDVMLTAYLGALRAACAGGLKEESR